MTEMRPDSSLDKLMRLVINLAAVGLTAGLIALIVATIIHEAGWG